MTEQIKVRTKSVKYLVCGGYITSKEDGNTHFVGAKEVARLYQVHPDECTFFNADIHRVRDFRTSLIILKPQEDGNYKLPEQKRICKCCGCEEGNNEHKYNEWCDTYGCAFPTDSEKV